MMGNEPTSFYRTSPGQSFTLGVPRAMLRSIVADADDTAMRLIPRNRGALGLLSRYAGWLLRVGASLDPELLNLSVRHIQDLLALTLGATNDFKEIARTRGLRAARLKLAKAYHSRAQPSARDFGRQRRRASVRDSAISAASVRGGRHHLLGIPAHATPCAGPPAALRVSMPFMLRSARSPMTRALATCPISIAAFGVCTA